MWLEILRLYSTFCTVPQHCERQFNKQNNVGEPGYVYDVRAIYNVRRRLVERVVPCNLMYIWWHELRKNVNRTVAETPPSLCKKIVFAIIQTPTTRPPQRRSTFPVFTRRGRGCIPSEAALLGHLLVAGSHHDPT